MNQMGRNILDFSRKMYRSFVGPELYAIYPTDEVLKQFPELKGFHSKPALEKWGALGLKTMKILWNMGLYASPVLALALYMKGSLTAESELLRARNFAVLFTVYTSLYLMRGIGRYRNVQHQAFIQAFYSMNHEVVKKNFDVEFKYWPTTYYAQKGNLPELVNGLRGGNLVVRKSLDVIAFLLINTGIPLKMVYPGSVKVLQAILDPQLRDGRTKYIVQHDGERIKIKTYGNNYIDGILFDRRKKYEFPYGRTLVVCCEGNCGFYEVGNVMTPLEAKYSVLGWNHPGFGGSTGAPYPEQERDAVEAIMEYAIDHLGFLQEDILIMGWSIGGYTSSHAARAYPNVQGLILDATFDNIVPLAKPRMPAALGPVVEALITNYVNLDILTNVKQYNGPVTIVIRSDDEMICTEVGNRSTNRGLHLALEFMTHRYKSLMDESTKSVVQNWLMDQPLNRVVTKDDLHVDKSACAALISNHLRDNQDLLSGLGKGLQPEQKKQLAIYLAEMHVKEIPSTHCTPLPVSMFRPPWNPSQQMK